MTDTCSNCRFSYKAPRDMADFFCRYDPPEFIPPATSTLKPVNPGGWCGRHEKAIVKRTKAT